MKKTFLAKFRADNYCYCILCRKYTKCNRLSASGCYSPDRDMVIDFTNTYSDFFTLKHDDAIKNFTEIYGDEG